MRYTIVTNNPLVQENIEFNIEYCNTLDEVMKSARDMIHVGYKLITHPLSGSVKPVQSPYKSIILQEVTDDKQENKLDYDSLKTIESAIIKVKQFKKNHTMTLKEYPKSILVDYQTIDFTLLQSGLKEI
ncbi:GrdX family protein [Halanaerobaculum tunisiense]